MKYFFVLIALASWQPANAAVEPPRISIRSMFSGIHIENAKVEWSRGKWSEQVTVQDLWPNSSCAERLLFLYPAVTPVLLLLSGVDLVLPHLKVVTKNHRRLDVPRGDSIGSIFQVAALYPDNPGLLRAFSVAPDDRVVRILLVVGNGSLASIDRLAPRAIALEFASGTRAAVDTSYGVWGTERTSPMGTLSHNHPHVRLLNMD